MMTDELAALAVAQRYFAAWTGGDIDGAIALVDEHIACAAPGGLLEGAVEFRAFLEPFSRTLLGVRMLGAFGDDEQALIMYDTSSAVASSAPAAELLTVTNGRITANTFIFDRTPFLAARAAAGAGA